MENIKLSRKKMIEDLTRKDILDSSIMVLLDKGINQFTMDQVASIAGIAKGTVYLYFKGKNELLDAVVDYCFEPLSKEYEEIAVSEDSPLSKLEQIVSKSMVFTESNKKIFNEVRNLMFNTLDKAIGDEKSWYWQTIKLISSVLEETIKSGKIRSVNTVKVAALFFESINALMSHRILTEVEETIEEDTKIIMELFLNGLLI